MGFYQPNTTGAIVDRTLTESWNGVSWEVDSSPNAEDHDNVMAGASWVLPKVCIAVGDYNNESDVQQTLVESYGRPSFCSTQTTMPTQ